MSTNGDEAARAPAWEIVLPEEGATEDLGRFLAGMLLPGDLVMLGGGLGAGKTTMARAMIRALTGDDALDVPSPTFTLLQPYEGVGGRSVIHADLYRLRGSDELVELGFDELTDAAITLVEWPDRLGPRDNPILSVELSLRPEFGEGSRFVRIETRNGMEERLVRARAIRRLLAQCGWDDADRVLMQGDASSRAYERLVRPETGETAVLMIAPPRPDGPPVRDGKPYSAIVKLAESIDAFVAMDRGLRALGFSAPKIIAEDRPRGLLVLEDLGSEPVVENGAPRPERYSEAVRLLAKLHATPLPLKLPVAEGVEHALPRYDLEALLFETELMPEWYTAHRGLTLGPEAKTEFLALWAEALGDLVNEPATWTLRDYHSPNLIWLAERAGLERVGLIDFQDAVLGHPAYDLASLLQDARVDASAEFELRLLGLYIRERRARDAQFDLEKFARAYAVLAAQRATKILGIFARLNKRDGKPGYLAHLPRIEGYLARNLNHAALQGLRRWHETHLPGLAPGGPADPPV
ncbi:tRNA (adenosine(37)-N6)-threonylcarbamoyltransferase complex ATPase subunit type 1 TsaE [Methylobacterium organophilum]|uniref:tRNA threonylcarbamoyladenosine biosynthesis protein TsaE n=1 Tax=Methylobacterium organophilum TaxID=410 RepID=A0ABQ4TAL9_METOR|nr:tRNA (adenosine(37)-N6)-threonylcarbamoyltransferase complex ATPase subunit type 1 TsaE [Methylobacterium organophilum]GJE28710.1 hypothetical protein LKMONMHP_3583 [Methylobacterium organophilum]